REEVDEDQAVLVIEALLCVMDADAQRDEEEESVLDALLATVPLFQQDDADLIIAAAQQQYQDAGGYPAALDHIERLAGENLRALCFVLAVEMAYVAGFGNDEAEVLERLVERLRVDETLVDATHSTMKAKYGREKTIDRAILAHTLMAVIMADGAFD